jgi:hypothetical protein
MSEIMSVEELTQPKKKSERETGVAKYLPKVHSL